jgi:peptidoglycan hydrolase-like protein with peptidoglycan-binding domain
MASISNSVGNNQPNDPGDVAIVQVLLNKFLFLGCLPGVAPLIVDGKFGKKTASAIVAFQKSIVGIKPDCWVTPIGGTMTALNGPIKWAVPDQPVAPPISSGQYVRWVKASLNRLLYCTLIDDGSAGLEYRSRVKEFQLNQKLNQSGEVNEATQDALMKRNRSYPDYVAWVQRALNRSGEGDGKLPVNGTWNATVEEVVKDFQTNEGLVVDGFVGAKTETALFARTGLPVPGRIKSRKPYKPILPDPDVWQDSLNSELRMNVWLNAMLFDRADTPDTPFMCLMRKLAKAQRGAAGFEYYTRSTITQYMRDGWPPPRGIEEIAEDALEELLEKTRQMQMRASYAKAWDGFQYFTIQLGLQIEEGLFALKSISEDDYDHYNTNVRDLRKWTRIRRDKDWAILSCYADLIDQYGIR